ncbi:MAG: ABC transporter permease [Chloroflexota bacterium]
MGRFLVRRLLQSVALILAVITASFVLIHAAPGGPESALLSNPRVTPEAVERLRERYGLNDPLPIRYVKWLEAAVQLDFGRSYAYQRPVVDVIADRVWPSAQLGLLSYFIGMLGIPLGVVAAMNRGRLGDTTIRTLTVLGTAVPTWWLSLTLIVLMNTYLGWFPNGQGGPDLADRLRRIALPAVLLSMGTIVAFTRFTRSEVLDVLGQDFVRTARAMGFSNRVVMLRHVFRNALISVVTLLGSLLPAAVSGAVATEFIFNWPGMGRLFLEAASTRDYPLLLAMMLLSTVLTIVGALLADLGYGVVDPRIRYA